MVLFLICLNVPLIIFDFWRHYKNLKSVDFWFWMSLDILAVVSYMCYYLNETIEMRSGSYGCMVLFDFMR